MSRETCTANGVQAGAFPACNDSPRDLSFIEATPPVPALANVLAVKDAIRDIARVVAQEATLPTLVLVAQRFCVTPRTLQRRLRDGGTSFRNLLSDVRLELATELLYGRGTVADAAHAAGFSEPSCFHRAFKRWTGQTPEDFRRRRGIDH